MYASLMSHKKNRKKHRLPLGVVTLFITFMVKIWWNVFRFVKKQMDLAQIEWKSKQQEIADSVIIDVRTDEEFEAGHMPDATQIDIRNPQGFMDAITELHEDKTYFVYCRSGARSAQACQLMQQQGLKAYNLLGGILDWEGPLR